MSSHRTLIRLSAVLAAVALAKGCGDGGSPTAPPTPARPTTVTVSPSTTGLTALGETVQLTAEVRDQSASVMAGVTIAWASSAAAVATVGASGLVTAAGNGVATITASAGSASGSAVVTVTTVEDPDRAVLIALYEATNGPKWVNNNGWLTDAPLGDWYGVDTDASGRVVRLDLRARWDDEARLWIPHGLKGPIPPELGNLTSLRWLYLSGNNLSGPIPPELGRLARLDELLLVQNNLSDPIPPELGNLANMTRLDLSENNLTGSIPLELGSLAILGTLSLGDNYLSGPIPPELGNLTSLRWLSLSSNNLSGPIPSELGNLANLGWLYLWNNNLSGLIPQSFLALEGLRAFHFEWNEGLCMPGATAFVAWLREIENRTGWESLCNAADVAALMSLYGTTGGTAWTNSDGWLGAGAVEDWHGVTADPLGRVTKLDLTRNALAGQLPANLSALAQMTELRIGDNALFGPLPLGLAQISLQTLHYAGTELCTPVEGSFRAWLNAIPSHEGTGSECGPPSERHILGALYHSTSGPEWVNDHNWLTDAPLREWFGVGADSDGRVTHLSLDSNSLSGAMPPELGSLANLRSLGLNNNDLSGSIPPELGNLASLQILSLVGNNLTGRIPAELGELSSLRYLFLDRNDLSGRIPAELGELSNLRYLDLVGNDLTGPIPPELGNLASLQILSLVGNDLSGRIPIELGGLADLEELYLGDNELTGPIPPELGDLADLRHLNFAANRLTGRIPAELGGLADLEELYLGDNELAGPVPPELGGLTRLRDLALQTNADLSGALPASLTALAALETLQTAGTDLCAPSDAGFLEWLEGIANRRVALCEGEPAMAYLVQAVQSREFPVPLVAGEEALLRVFVTAGRDNDERLPPIRASFYLNGGLAHVAEIAGKPGPIPTEVDEGSLATSGNAVVPAEVVRPGLEMVVEVDPDGTLDPALGVVGRIPATGRAAISVRAMPVFDLTLVPFLWTRGPDSSVLAAARGMAADPEGHELLELTRTLLPVGELTVTAHEPVLSPSNNTYDLINQTRAIRAIEGGTGYYMGTMAGRITGAPGLGGGLASFAIPYGRTIAHEFGHNFSLPHAPCGGASNPDPAYPTPDGTIGAWGYDFETGRLVPPTSFDIMGYCPNDWISDYFFSTALRFRIASEGAPVAAAVAAARSLLLWGGADTDDELYLEPAFVVDAPAALPDSTGEHRITGRTTSGGELFSLSFTMPEAADGDGSSSFALVLPVRPEWESSLSSITLSGPEGAVTLDGDSGIPMAILRNPRTGQVRGFLRELPPAAQAARDAAGQAAGPDLDVLFSRGIPDAEAWQR